MHKLDYLGSLVAQLNSPIGLGWSRRRIMAAIIAQITRKERERKLRELQHPTVDIQHSVYQLQRLATLKSDSKNRNLQKP